MTRSCGFLADRKRLKELLEAVKKDLSRAKDTSFFGAVTSKGRLPGQLTLYCPALCGKTRLHAS